MKKFFQNLLMNILLFGVSASDTISVFAAKLIAKLLNNASSKGGVYWDNAKKTIKEINNWSSLFLQVYDDDNLTPEEEDMIAEAIKNRTPVGKINDIIKTR